MSLHRPSKNARLMTAHSSAAILRLSLLSAQTSDLQSGIPTAAQRPWQAAPSACTITKRYQSSRLLRSRHHRCCPLYCAPGRLDGFSSLRSLRSVPLTHCGCAPASLTLIRCSASAHSGSTTLAPPRNHQDSRSVTRVSTTMCSFLPFIFLLPSIPLWPSAWWEVLTLLESMIPRLGLSSLPERRRTMPRRVSKISSSKPSFFHLLK